MAKTTEMVEVAVSKLVPYEKNAKQHGEEQIERLKNSIQEFGFVSPCIIDRDYNLIAGHGRLEAAKQLGIEKVPCVFVEGLTDEQRRAYIIADNRLGELGEWNMDLVAEELRSLADAGFDIDLTGFEDYELADFDEETNAIKGVSNYSRKVNIPQYEPTGEEVDVEECVDLEKTYELMSEIDDADIPKDVAEFLKIAAYRHAVFNYRKIAEFYANADKDIQELMERSALVIIDVEDAIANGYCKLTKTISDILSEVADEQ